MPGFSKLERLPLDRQHASKHLQSLHMSIQDIESVPSQSSFILTLKLMTGGLGHIQMEAALSITVGKKLEQASITHVLTTRTCRT
eukprot:584435-Pelagomonas_calceolata.AAC.1